MTIVAVDPGGTTGVAIMKDGAVSTLQFTKWAQLSEIIDSDCTVICERPFLRSLSVDTVVFEVFGAVQYQCFLVNAKITFQGGDITHFVWRRYKKELANKSISTTFSQHKKDALAHLLYYWVHKEMKPLSEFLAMMKNKGE